MKIYLERDTVGREEEGGREAVEGEANYSNVELDYYHHRQYSNPSLLYV